MKLQNQSIKYFLISFLIIVTAWSIVFYFNMLNEIKSSIDEGLENHKRLIIQNTKKDTSSITKKHFDESLFTIHKIKKEEAFSVKDQYIDTEIYMQDADDKTPELEPVRMLITAFEMDGQYYQLKVANSMVEEDDLIDELLWDVVWLYIILIVGIIVINNFVLKTLWKPFYEFLSQLKKYRLGQTEEFPQTNSNTKEFQDLQKVVNTLLKENLETFEQQKQFIGNASHELQTPLAIASNKLELLLENKNLGNTEAENVVEIFTIIQRMIRLNKSLLLLTKIENKQFLNNKTISVNEIVHQCLEDLEDTISYKNIKINTVEKTGLSTEMDASLANIMISNLIRNAVFHTNKNENIEIDITQNTFTISNSGQNKKLDEKQIFSRFYKSENETKGIGLGLAIVKAIADLYDYSIFYKYENNTHYFSINFIQNG